MLHKTSKTIFPIGVPVSIASAMLSSLGYFRKDVTITLKAELCL